ncbi:MAG: DEAD/DEAH box helicase [Caldilineaceae bacterium SB0664_bin_22]|nr:DEAD/DEAH box helicase [Caldilineaceae bacterium SB0664_bin_22]
MSKASRRKRHKRKQQRQSNQHDSPVAAPPLLDTTPAKADVGQSDWQPMDGDLGSYIQDRTQRTLNSYHQQPDLVEEHANLEHDTARGGYAHRQLFELIQNSTDALADSTGGRISLKLTHTHLYCADDGQAMSQEGVRALMFSHLSPKRSTAEIGRFGMGFKAVLGVTDSPEFFSRSGSFRFDRTEASKLIQQFVPNAEHCPVLRLPYPMDPWTEMEQDADLQGFMAWATNIVRLPLLPSAFDDLAEQCETFRAEFLLFVGHVARLTIRTGGDERVIRVQRGDDEDYTLLDGDKKSQWKLYSTVHELSDEARADSRNLDDAGEVPIVWAAPLNQYMQGEFWAFFPTLTKSLLNGILNAPWKTNEDRQNLLEGVFNDELIGAAAELVAVSIADLSSADDPGSHLDVLPRRPEPGDNPHCNLLRDWLYSELAGQPIVPDQHGTLRQPDQLHYQPADLVTSRTFALEALAAWADYEHRPTDWLHHSALRWDRLPRCEWLHAFAVEQDDESIEWNPNEDNWTLPRVVVGRWLEALVQAAEGWEQAVEASKAAIQAAAKVQDFLSAKGKNALFGWELGAIVLTTAGSWAKPNPEQLFLGSDEEKTSGKFVHPQLERCAATKASLERLGLKPFSDQKEFGNTVSKALASLLAWLCRDPLDDQVHEKLPDQIDEAGSQLWSKSRLLPPEEAAAIIREGARFLPPGDLLNYLIRNKIAPRNRGGIASLQIAGLRIDDIDLCASVPVRTVSGDWVPLSKALLPGEIVPRDGSRDAAVAVDLEFHGADLELLGLLGAVSAPVAERQPPPLHLFRYQTACRAEFQTAAQVETGHKPRVTHLHFRTNVCAGPLGPLENLSEEGCALYTWRLLDFDTAYTEWAMVHETQPNKYDPVPFLSPALDVLRKFGMVRTTTGFAKLDGIIDGAETNPDVVKALMSHPKADRIRQVFQEADWAAILEPVGAEEKMPLLDVWPGLRTSLTSTEADLQLVRCEGFHNTHTGSISQQACTRDHANNILYVAQQAGEEEELAAVLDALEKTYDQSDLEAILNGTEPPGIRTSVEAVRQCRTEGERLLTAVGLAGLKRHLPEILQIMLTERNSSASGIDIARAAIAKFHTGALEACKSDLEHLNPPSRWAGSARAVRFVQSLGFDDEWAGQRNTGRDSFLEVPGPHTLPPLHDYQRKAVRNVRDLVSGNCSSSHRGLLSMPTGSGKTRVAVQALVEAMREGELQGGVLWVADRDELCQQAVEAWQEVWASEGEQDTTLRVSRLWGGVSGINQPPPTSRRHVVVATIQTLASRFEMKSQEYQFLANFPVVVVDEAHRSIAPSYTSVLQDLGLTRWFSGHEPTLIGLTATPYRTNEEETSRLRHRYGARRLDHDIFPTRDSEAVIRHLQADGVLAMADHTIIDGGAFDLSDAERRELERNPYWLPQSVEDQIAQDDTRTRRILDAYRDKVGPDWATLIFATSVAHAEVVAGLLNADGIAARAVSGNTKSSVRRSMVHGFRAGLIKVLVNYGIFREGFDAPKTQAIVVARPVFSPNLYFQMIGRGLRGEKNGGNERCLILNVSDNIRNFGLDLAFTELDWLWST